MLSSVAGTHRETTVEAVGDLLEDAKDIIIAPGYGLCVAKAQYPISELVKLLTKRGKRVRFAIHPVAGKSLSNPFQNGTLQTTKLAIHWFLKHDTLIGPV